MPMSENPLQVPPRPTSLLHTLLREVIREGDTVVDATAGNGYDTVFLADCVGDNGKVLAFDIQEAAILSASARVGEAGFMERVVFLHNSHCQLPDHLAPQSASAIVFNLGYLPGADHDATTTVNETLDALTKSLPILKSGGILAVVCYPGHPAGAVEATAVEQWMASLTSSKWRVAKYAALGTLRPAPFLLMACR